MILTRLTLDPKRAGLASVYDVHKRLWDLFGDHADRDRDFLYREMSPGRYLCLSAREPVDAKGIWTMDINTFDPKLKKGNRLMFSLRANAVVKTRDASGRQIRHDIVQHTRKKLQEEGVADADMPSSAEVAQEQGCAWFVKRQDGFGVELDEPTFLAESYSQQSFYKKNSGKGSISCIDMQGFVTVMDPDLLLQAIHKGIGPAKGFGCGLMLIRRA